MILSLAPLVAAAAIASAPTLQWKPLGEPGSGGCLTSLRESPLEPSHLVLGGDMLGLGVSRDGGANWSGGEGFKSWEIADSTFDPTVPGLVWVGTMSGPYVSRDGGLNWEERRAGFPDVAPGMYSAPVQKVLIDPADNQRLLAFGGTYRGWNSPGSPRMGYVFESADGGKTWKELVAIRAFRNITWADADREWKRLYAAVEGQGIYTSVDRGRTWKKASGGIPNPGDARMVAVDPRNGNLAYAAVGNARAGDGYSPGGIYKTEDGGTTWKQLDGGLPRRAGKEWQFTTRFQAVAVSPVDPNLVATSDMAWDNDAVYLSRDAGANWEKVLSKSAMAGVPVGYPAGMGASVITFSPTNAETLYLANTESVLATSDAGKTWRDLTASRVDAEQSTWSGHGYSGLCAVRAVFNPRLPGSMILTAMDAGKFLRSDDDGRTWRFPGPGLSSPWGGGNDAAFGGENGEIVYLAIGQHDNMGAVARSNDGGRTWTEFSGNGNGLPGQAQVTAVHCDPDSPDTAWATAAGALYRTDDGGRRWTKIPGLEEARTIGRLFGRALPFFVGAKDGIYRTDDGRDFSLMPGSPATPTAITVVSTEPGGLFAVRSRRENAGVFRWDGDAWKCIFSNEYSHDVAVSPADPNRLAVATSDDPFHDHSRASGVWISADAGKTWSAANQGLPCLRVSSIAFDPHDPTELVLGSFGRGFFKSRWIETECDAPSKP